METAAVAVVAKAVVEVDQAEAAVVVVSQEVNKVAKEEEEVAVAAEVEEKCQELRQLNKVTSLAAENLFLFLILQIQVCLLPESPVYEEETEWRISGRAQGNSSSGFSPRNPLEALLIAWPFFSSSYLSGTLGQGEGRSF